MSNPGAFGDPDRMTSPQFHGNNSDNGGVHINSGVNNKAATLLVDGGTFNGKTVTALGIDKTAKIYYEVQTNLLTPGSDYGDLYTAMQQACFTLVTTGVTTNADCQEVLDAIQAVEMHLLPVTSGAPAVNAPFCPAGQAPTNVFFDDLENTASGNWSSSALTGSNSWNYPPAADYVNTTSGTKNFHGFNRSTTASYVMAKNANVTLPAGAFLRFNRSWTFDTDVASNTLQYWDGGILEYTTNNGSSWVNASPLITEGGYTGTLQTTAQGNSNPLQGQSAWVGSSDYGSTRVNLASLSGQSFRFRFRIGTDSSIAADGWFIDDVRIYTCSAGPAAGITVTPTSGLTTTEAGGTATFTVKLNTVPTNNVTVGLSSSDTTEGNVGPLSLLFTPLNALTPQTVTVTGVPDALDDGNVAYTIVTAPAVSVDASYNSVNAADVSVTNTSAASPPQACQPRPRVVLSSAAAPGGGGLVTIQAGSGNLQSIQVGTPTSALTNAVIDFPGVGNNLTAGFTRTFTEPTTQVTFTVRRAAGGYVSVPLIVTDGCGAWTTLFGGGQNGF